MARSLVGSEVGRKALGVPFGIGFAVRVACRPLHPNPLERRDPVLFEEVDLGYDDVPDFDEPFDEDEGWSMSVSIADPSLWVCEVSFSPD